jgi:hypothetical protein
VMYTIWMTVASIVASRSAYLLIST